MVRPSRRAQRQKEREVVYLHEAGLPAEVISKRVRLRKSTVLKLLAATGFAPTSDTPSIEEELTPDPLRLTRSRRLGEVYVKNAR